MIQNIRFTGWIVSIKYTIERNRTKTINNNAMKEERSRARHSSLTITDNLTCSPIWLNRQRYTSRRIHRIITSQIYCLADLLPPVTDFASKSNAFFDQRKNVFVIVFTSQEISEQTCKTRYDDTTQHNTMIRNRRDTSNARADSA